MTVMPQYYREYFYIFATTGKDIPFDMANFLMEECDLELLKDDVTFIAKGSKENVEKCVEKYSEFFENWERIDKRVLEIYDVTDELVARVNCLPHYFESIGGVANKKEYNEEIDSLIEELNKIKID